MEAAAAEESLLSRVCVAGDVGFLDLDAGIADGLDFPAFEHDAGFETVLDEVVKKCFFIICYGHEFGNANDKPVPGRLNFGFAYKITAERPSFHIIANG